MHNEQWRVLIHALYLYSLYPAFPAMRKYGWHSAVAAKSRPDNGSPRDELCGQVPAPPGVEVKDLHAGRASAARSPATGRGRSRRT
jgi:hypothetical protein